jgi:DNA repair exonuclease SbcCD ATPase subunit
VPSLPLNSETLTRELEYTLKKQRSLEEELEALTKESKNLLKVQKYLQQVISNKLEEIENKTVPIINSMLKTVFYEDDLQFKFKSEVKYGKMVYVPSIIDGKTGLEGDVEDFGGGVLTITSALLRMLFILIADAPRFLVLDEGLNPVSPKYRPRVSEFLSKLCKELDFTFILISFDEGEHFSNYAEVVYEVEAKNGKTKYTRTK